MKKMIKILMVFFIAFIFLVGVNILSNQFDVRKDVTEFKQHTLTPFTVEVVSQLKEPINITALIVGVAPKYLEDLFKEYERVSDGKIQTKIIDPLVDIGYASRFGNIINGDERKIVIQSGKERRDLTFTDEDLPTEEGLTNGIIRVTRKKRFVYFLAGHGEYDLLSEEDTGLKSFAAMLADNNIISKQLFLEKEEVIPKDCDVLVIAGAQRFLKEKERKIIQEYLSRGGDALFLVEHIKITTPDQPLSKEDLLLNPSMNNILNEWGIDVRTDIVVDLGSHASGDVGSPATKNYMNHRDLIKGLDYTFYVRPRSILGIRPSRPTIKTVPFVLTASEKLSWGETNRNLEITYDEGEDTPGPVAISYVVWEGKNQEKPSDTRLLVFTDADFLSNAYISSYSNAQMGLNLIQWLSELDYQLFLNKKQIEMKKLNLTSRQKKHVLVILIVIPLLVLVFGIGSILRKN